MRVFIGNLPLDFNSYELRKLACSVLLPTNTMALLSEIFKKNHKIKRAAFEVINGANGYYEVPFGVIYIEPDIMGRKLIQRLNNRFFRDSVLIAREFYVRTYSNDRRALNWRNKVWEKQERRIEDRRMGVIIPSKSNTIQNNQ